MQKDQGQGNMGAHMKVIITGASAGIGLAVCERFLQDRRITVVGIDINPGKLVNERYHHVLADVSDLESLPEIGEVTHLINNAGVQNTSQDIAINLGGVMNCTRLYGLQPAIQSIVNVASASAHSGAEFPEYVASKGGVVAYTKWTALQVAQYGATCNSISPGGVLTELNRPVMDDPDKWRAIMAETLLPKWASAEEIAEWVYFMATVNRSMTAQDILVDNGEMAKSNFVW
ncbi:SDR family NAD(P)-dependent oxidoreductase [Endozoicomonas sp. SCSIO W0465]|uniref:SDR family NAD(P)-dependent oxidoreductase n=1 Tax=Endozoicomonas sp. SCSIO W0465 TaxID=2918516 RepID=UPI002075C113|nr:SDR family oxidoreductase [Endozoicomonas sp. SCSIO W0465]USE34257.1 SDR family oxidoreductase [Endozoicomonas sp. SCSIO W0465]